MISTVVLYLCGYLTCVYIVYINCGFPVRAFSWMSASSLSVGLLLVVASVIGAYILIPDFYEINLPLGPPHHCGGA